MSAPHAMPTRRHRRLRLRAARWVAARHAALSLVAVYLLAASATVVAVRHELRAQAVRDATFTAEQALHRNLAIHAYLNGRLQPAVLPLTGRARDPGYFDPAWMSSTYAVREIQGLYRRAGADAGATVNVYKEAAIDARSPANEADPAERAFLERAAADPALVTWSGVREIDGEAWLVVMRRGETMQESCLGCHGDPADAPADLVRTYGAGRSFGRHAGQLVSAMSVRVPLAAAYASATAFTVRLSLTLLAVLAAALGVHFALQHRRLVVPVRRLAGAARVLARAPAQVRDVPLPAARELRRLTRVFNGTARRVARRDEELERAVAERTRALEEVHRRVERDLAERLALERALRDHEERFRSVIAALSEGLVVHDPDGTVVYANPAAPRILGTPAAALDGIAAERLFPGAAGEDGVVLPREGLPPLAALRTGAPVVDAVTSFERPDGSTGWLAVNAVPFRWPGAAARQGVVTTFADVTVRRTLEARIVMSDRLASLGTIAAGLAHEINNPLSYVTANLAFVREQLPAVAPDGAADEARSAADEAAQGVARVREIVAALRRFAHPGEGRRVPVDVLAELSQAAKMTAHRVARSGRIELVLPPTLPPVMARELELSQVFVNLIANAADALAPERAAENVVRVSATHAGGAVTVVVEDNGCGIPPSLRPRIFDPFVTTKTIGRGTGLGLSVCHGIVSAIGGRIAVESDERAGSRFEVVLPVWSGGRAELGRVARA